tara:strand:+ start:207 stop:1058 length:852 start_codon:yes stop_codon:yes gene_type:complete
LKNSKIVNIGITGSTGVLGKKLINELRKFDLKIFKGDISAKKDVFDWINNNDLDGLIHFAAVVPTINVLKNKKKSYQINYMGTKYLVEALKNKKKKIWFFFASSSHVYSFSKRKVNEKSVIKPISYYGVLKRKCEVYLLNNRSHLDICIGRIFSFTDPKQDRSFFVPSIFNKIKKNQKYLYGELNKEVRDFVSTKDIVKIIKNLLEIRFLGIINICSGQGVSLFKIYSIISNLLNKSNTSKNHFDKKNILIGDNSKIVKMGYKYKDNINKIIKNYVKINKLYK